MVAEVDIVGVVVADGVVDVAVVCPELPQALSTSNNRTVTVINITLFIMSPCRPLYNYLPVAGRVTLQVNGHRQGGNMGGEGLYMYGEGSNPAAISHRADAQVIDFM